MASEKLKAAIFLLAMAFFSLSASSQPKDCTDAIISLAPCIDYITGAAATPSGPCCSQLATVVQSEPLCLCTILNGGGSQFGININQTLALALPGACHVETPPVSRCYAAVPSPAVVPPGGGSSNGEDSGGSVLRPMAFSTVVLSIVTTLMDCHAMSSLIF